MGAIWFFLGLITGIGGTFVWALLSNPPGDLAAWERDDTDIGAPQSD